MEINIWCTLFWCLVSFLAGLGVGCLVCHDTDDI